MQLSEVDLRAHLAKARVLRLATADVHATTHLVPATFAVRENLVVVAVDHKPKRHQKLKRLRNIMENPQVCVLVDHYDDDWTQLWWVRGDGRARILEGEDRREPLEWLAEKYPQYREQVPTGPVIEITIERWSGWAYTDPASSE